eukprot:TRINITY_DN4900_c0_g1_i1.p1 TRINITY_DN4900_c0_g1~~TRINITY_DN4900_c0_g1_i1.p1  ORF type:complete len:263 (+),score=37.20 TRINITY_DN4900_c0_g1_i1:44-832(+)
MVQLVGRRYETSLELEDVEEGKLERQAGSAEAPQQWPSFGMGSGLFEVQGFEGWTAEEQQQFYDGKLKKKVAFGQVSIRMPVKSASALIAIVYGYLPFVIPLWWLIWLLASWAQHGKPRFFPQAGLCIAVLFALVNETVTKQVCKRLLPADITNRPPEAVCKRPGMPSGHVMNAYTLMTWCFLECVFDAQVHVDWLVLIILVMGPVPWARVYNKDHTVLQVAASAPVAVCMGCLAYRIRASYFPYNHQPWEYYHVDALEFGR